MSGLGKVKVKLQKLADKHGVGHPPQGTPSSLLWYIMSLRDKGVLGSGKKSSGKPSATPSPAPAPAPAPAPVPTSSNWGDIVNASFPQQAKAGGLVRGRKKPSIGGTKKMAGGGMARGYGCAQRGLKHSKKMG